MMIRRKTGKSVLAIFAASTGVLFLLPLLAVYLARGDAGMAICFILFYLIDPVFSLLVGAVAGTDFYRLWYTAAIPAVLYLLSCWVLFTMTEPAFIFYASIYLGLSVFSMCISHLIAKIRAK